MGAVISWGFTCCSSFGRSDAASSLDGGGWHGERVCCCGEGDIVVKEGRCCVEEIGAEEPRWSRVLFYFENESEAAKRVLN